MIGSVLRRTSLVLAAASFFPTAATAQAWPSKPIRMIVPFPPGGATDFMARIVGQKLSERLGQSVPIDNRSGANGILGLQALLAAPPDGHALATVSAGPIAVNPHLYKKLPYDSLRDFTYIGNMVNIPLMLVAHPSLGVKNVKQLIALAKTRPGEITYSSPGVGNSSHLAPELFNYMAKVNTLHVPYKGMAPAVQSVLAGEAHIIYSSIPPILPHVRSGRVVALAIGNAQRVPSLPDIPTVAESGVPGYEAYSWTGLIGPAKMPKDVVDRLNRELVQILGMKDMQERLLAEGTVPAPSTPEEFRAYAAAEIRKWGEVVKIAKIPPE
jgi:tripartite-type tricarboxylate transporter receptor subunit TctC